MVSFFRDKSPAAVIWLLITCFALHIDTLLTPTPVTAVPADGLLYYLVQPLKNAPPYFASLLFVGMIYLLALQINFLMNALHLLQRPGHTAALAFILFTALLPSLNTVAPALFACNVFIWILYRACKLYAAPKPKTAIYNFGLLTGIGVFLYFPALPIVLMALFALAIMRAFRPNEWFVLIFGIITPAYFAGTYLFLTDRLGSVPNLLNVLNVAPVPLQPVPIIISLSIVVFCTVWGMFSVSGGGGNVLIQVRKSWSVFFVAILFTTPSIFLFAHAFPGALLLTAVPAACYTGYAFAVNRHILPVIFFWILLGLAVYNNWFAF